MADNAASLDTSTSVEPAPAEKPQKNPLRRTVLVVVLITILLFTLSVAMERLTPVSSEAAIQAYVVRMASEVTGRVLEVGVTDNARVAAGQVLFRIDPKPYEIAVAEAEARLERIGQVIGASTQAVASAQAKLVKAQADRANARAQMERTGSLVERGVASRAKFDEATAALGISEATVTGAEADLAQARAELGPQGNDNPQFKEAVAALEQARLNLLHTTVLAPSDGVVTNLQLGVGQVVGTGQAALTFIDAGTIWVAAAYKENSLEYMAPGNKAEVVLDLQPGRVFAMRVESVGWGVSQGNVDPSTGLPSIRNESGWVREPQRFPVRLVFTDTQPRGIRYGSQVNAVIYTGGNPVMNAVGHVWIRLISVLTYVS
jgi:multidrug resistance efflux pump